MRKLLSISLFCLYLACPLPLLSQDATHALFVENAGQWQGEFDYKLKLSSGALYFQKDGFILKHISFFADGKNHNYTEKVKYLDLKKMKAYLEKVGFNITFMFGDYNLNNFDIKKSNRLILVAK